MLEAVLNNATLNCNTCHHLAVSCALASTTDTPEICVHMYCTVLAKMLAQGHILCTCIWQECVYKLKNNHGTIAIEKRTSVDGNYFDQKDPVNHLIQ